MTFLERLRRWWWCFWNPTSRVVYRRPTRLEGGWPTYAVMARQRQRREPFGEWHDVGRPTLLNSVSWPDHMWDRFERDDRLVEHE